MSFKRFFLSAKEYKEYAQVWIWSSLKNLNHRVVFLWEISRLPKLLPSSIIQNPQHSEDPGTAVAVAQAAAALRRPAVDKVQLARMRKLQDLRSTLGRRFRGKLGMSRKCLDYFGLKRSRPMCEKLDFGKPGSHQTYHPNDFASTMPP